MKDDELIERALLHELSAEEEALLAARLKNEPPLARRMMEMSRDEALLLDGVREARASRGLSDAVPPGAGRRPSALWVAALVGIAALLILFFPKRDAAKATILDLRGAVEIDDHDALAGDQGRVVKTGADGRATLKLVDGSRLLLSGLSHFEVETADRSRLHAGFLEVTDGRVRLARGTE